jgi:hypothetical protein
LESVPHRKPVPVLSNRERATTAYGRHETRATKHRIDPWMNWLFGRENPEPVKRIVAIRLLPRQEVILISGITAG